VTSSISLGRYPAARPLNADQITEYHAARLLLLLRLCGTKGRTITGLTKLAKLDFFVRYPAFFNRAAAHLDESGSSIVHSDTVVNDSPMIRHRYGPWDPRYYQVLAYLEGRELLNVDKHDKAFVFSLTDKGHELAAKLAGESSFRELVEQMKKVKSIFGDKNGDWLKRLIYRVFEDEVAKLVRGQVIR